MSNLFQHCMVESKSEGRGTMWDGVDPEDVLLDWHSQQQIYIDGGARRGTDVIKALCLGAKGVGMGRPFLYALTYGEEGVTHAIESESMVSFAISPASRCNVCNVAISDIRPCPCFSFFSLFSFPSLSLSLSLSLSSCNLLHCALREWPGHDVLLQA